MAIMVIVMISIIVLMAIISLIIFSKRKIENKEDDFSMIGKTNTSVSNNSGEYLYKTFYMIAEDVFTITGKGIVVTGTVEKGSV